MTRKGSARLPRDVSRRQVMIGAAGLSFGVMTGLVPVSNLMIGSKAEVLADSRRSCGRVGRRLFILAAA